MHKYSVVVALFFTTSVFGQLQLGAYVGAAGYIGDLNDKPFKRVKPAGGLSLGYQFTNRLVLRGSLTAAKVEGADSYSGTTFLKQNRNLSFISNITEASLVAEYNLFNQENINWTPYIFGGITAFYFNPYVMDSGRKVFLKSLSTEGQGLPEYPDRYYYSRGQWAIPFGGGVKFIASEKLNLNFELGFRRLFTDYLDDVSTTHVDGDILLARRGYKAYQLSYRGNEVPGGITLYPDNGYPAKDVTRGNAKTKDWYYFTGVHIIFKINTGGDGSVRSSSRGYKMRKQRGGYGCPTNVY